MLFDPNYVRYLSEEHERRVHALLLERTALKARAARASAMAALAGRSFRLAAGLATKTWRWGWGTFHRMRWAPPLPSKPYG